MYGEAHVQDRHMMWDLLRRIKSNNNDPWMMVGDFNETMWQDEHFSVIKRWENQMAEFREVLPLCNLHDLEFVGASWTCNSKREGTRNLRVRLDRVVTNPDWSDHFSDPRVKHLCRPDQTIALF